MGIQATSRMSSANGKTSRLEQEICQLREELKQSREIIRKIHEQEKHLRERLAGQIHGQFLSRPNQMVEDLNLGPQRPSNMIRSYDDLYREGRVDALDALDSFEELQGLDILKMKILFSVVVLAFRCVQQTLNYLRGKLRHMLCLPSTENSQQATDRVSLDMENSISNYLSKTVERYDIDPIVQEVSENIFTTLYDYPGLKACLALAEYTRTVVRLAWGLSVQTPAYCIVYDSLTFQTHCHDRFHTSDSSSDVIKTFLWPMLVESGSGLCVAKGVVIT